MSYLRSKVLRSRYSPTYRSFPFLITVKTIFKKPVNDENNSMQNINSNSIFISLSKDIYRNLALEDWMYKNYDFSSKEIYSLLMWYNNPSVVIGRHQNPWVECSMDFSTAGGISVARRNSGGGTVFHDLGNLNCSFMSARSRYDRKSNLNLICESLQHHWPLNLMISKREDILLDDKYKISGTASKLGRNNAYHHCTILVNVDQIMLHHVLHRELCGVNSKATSSIKSEVKNLHAACPEVTIQGVIKAVKKQYQSIYKVSEHQVYTIEPKEDTFPGLQSIETHLKSWGWCFGKTPRFHISRSFPLCPSFSKWEKKSMPSDLEIRLSVNHGIIEDVAILPQILEENNLVELKNCIVTVHFSPCKVEKSLEKFIDMSPDKILCRFLKSCILQMIFDIYR